MASPAAIRAVVAIPARDEAERIEDCLCALDRQSHLPDRVVLLLNNCSDETEMLARLLAPRLHYRLHTISTELPKDKFGAGHARRLAMQTAFEETSGQDVLLTTDADAVTPPDWIAANLQAIAAGADVVCGQAIIAPDEALAIPSHLHADDELECRLLGLLDTMAWRLDPELHDPAPRHTEASGASLAVTAAAYRGVGGIPDIASGEDRAFVRALWMADAAVRHDPSIRVTVSGRIDGRAQGGMADTIRRRIVQQDEFTDAQLEPAADASRRYWARRLFRVARTRGADAQLPHLLGISQPQLRAALRLPCFGAAWADLEAHSPILQRRRVRFCELSNEIAAAETLLQQITTSGQLEAA